jgi:hypothetical protein
VVGGPGSRETPEDPAARDREYTTGVISARAVVALLIAALLLGLTPVAYSDAADPTWLAGYWDDDDFDNAVVVIVAPCAPST